MGLVFTAVALLGAIFTSAQEPPSVQIGRPITVRASTAPLTGPLSIPINLNIPDGTLGAFFDEVGRQSKTEYVLVQGLEKCRIGAFIRNLPVRQLLQLTIEAGGMTYQQLGRSNSYTIVRRHGGPACPPPPRPAPSGSCVSGSKPISLECKNAPLTALAQGLFEQSNASIIVWNDAVDYPASIKFKKASLQKAFKQLAKIKDISVRPIGNDARFLISMAKPAVESEEFANLPSSAAVHYGTRRNEPPANPAYEQPQPSLFIIGSSYGHKITVHACGKMVWNAVVPESDLSPNVRGVDLPPNPGETCSLVISGGPYKTKRTINWSRGPRLMIGFDRRGTLSINQDDGKGRFL